MTIKRLSTACASISLTSQLCQATFDPTQKAQFGRKGPPFTCGEAFTGQIHTAVKHLLQKYFTKVPFCSSFCLTQQWAFNDHHAIQMSIGAWCDVVATCSKIIVHDTRICLGLSTYWIGWISFDIPRTCDKDFVATAKTSANDLCAQVSLHLHSDGILVDAWWPGEAVSEYEGCRCPLIQLRMQHSKIRRSGMQASRERHLCAFLMQNLDNGEICLSREIGIISCKGLRLSGAAPHWQNGRPLRRNVTVFRAPNIDGFMIDFVDAILKLLKSWVRYITSKLIVRPRNSSYFVLGRRKYSM